MSGDFGVNRSFRPESIESESKQEQRLSAKKLTQFVINQKLIKEESIAWTELDAFNPLAQTRRFEQLERRKKRRVSGTEDAESEGAGAKDERKIEKVKSIDKIAEHYQKKNRELQSNRLLELKDQIRQGDTPQQILEKVMKVFPDPSLADEAIEFLLATLEGDPAGAELAGNLIGAKQLLEKTLGREVRAGRNIQQAAHEYEGHALESATALRQLYREITGNPRHPYDLFFEFADAYNYDQIKQLIYFLLHAVGQDLNSKGPSIERAELVRLFSEARTLQAILGVYRFFSARMRLISRFYAQHGLSPNIFLSFEALAKAFMSLVKERYPNSDRVLDLADVLHVDDELLAQSITFAQFRDAIRSVSPRVYRNQQHQEDLYTAIIDALEEVDNKLEEEEEETEDEEL